MTNTQTARTSLLTFSLALLAALPASATPVWADNLASLKRETATRVRYADDNARRVLSDSGIDCAQHIREGAPRDRMIPFDTALRMYMRQNMMLYGLDKNSEYPFLKAATTKNGTVIVDLIARQPNGQMVSQTGLVVSKTTYRSEIFSADSKLGACTGMMGQYFE